MNTTGYLIEALSELLARQHDVASRSQLLAAGFEDSAITRRIRRGEWQRIAPGIYALHTAVLGIEQRRIAAALYAGAGAQLTGASALHWYGFRYVPTTDKVHMLVPHATRRRSVGVIVIQRTHDMDQRPRDAGTYQVVSPERAVVDAARTAADITTVRAIFAEAIQRTFTDINAMAAELRRAKRSRTAVANRVLAELIDGVRSSPEAELRELVRRSRLLPPMLWNPLLVADDDTRLPSPDAFLPDVGIALEVDSQEHHATSEGFQKTLRRGNALSLRGAAVLHFTPAEIRAEPARVLRVIEAAYRNRLEHPVSVSIRAYPRQ